LYTFGKKHFSFFVRDAASTEIILAKPISHSSPRLRLPYRALFEASGAFMNILSVQSLFDFDGRWRFFGRFHQRRFSWCSVVFDGAHGTCYCKNWIGSSTTLIEIMDTTAKLTINKLMVSKSFWPSEGLTQKGRFLARKVMNVEIKMQ
jgi:hypothetical protein